MHVKKSGTSPFHQSAFLKLLLWLEMHKTSLLNLNVKLENVTKIFEKLKEPLRRQLQIKKKAAVYFLHLRIISYSCYWMKGIDGIIVGRDCLLKRISFILTCIHNPFITWFTQTITSLNLDTHFAFFLNHVLV